jgi:hypothetical protein
VENGSYSNSSLSYMWRSLIRAYGTIEYCKTDFFHFLCYFFALNIYKKRFYIWMRLYADEIDFTSSKKSARNMFTCMIHLDSLCILIVGVMWCMKGSLILYFLRWNGTNKNCTKYNSQEKIWFGRRVLYCEDVRCMCTLTSIPRKLYLLSQFSIN